MNKEEIKVLIDKDEFAYLEKITSELKLDGIEETVAKLIKDAGKDWFDTLNQEKFKSKIKSIPIENLSDVISSIPFLSRKYKTGFDSEIIELIVERLMGWDESIPELTTLLYRVNNIRIMARDLKMIKTELGREIEGDIGVSLPLYDKEQVIRLLVSALYRS